MSRARPVLAAVAALAALLALPRPAASNGRFPASTSVHTRPGDDESIYLGLTFGLLISHDDGAHFHWTCEDNIGYSGRFDPKYAIAPDGTIYATTYDGLRVSEDGGCSFRTATAGGTDELVGIWVDAIDVAPDGTVWFGTAETGLGNAVYRSTDKGVTVEKMGLDTKTAWWKSLEIAPSNPQRIYVTGYQVAPTAEVFVYRSDDGGKSWDAMPTTDLVLGSEPLVLIEGVDPTDPDIVYLRSVKIAKPAGDRLYRSADGGQTWTGVLDTDKTLRGIAVRGSGEVVTGTVDSADPVAGCTYRSSNRGTTFSACELGPQMACIAERGDGELFACGGNWDPDFFTLGRSTDGASWTPVIRFHEMTGPLDCPQGTTSFDVCTLEQWPMIQEQFGVLVPDAGPVEPEPPPPPDGCCDAGGSGAATMLLGLGVAGLLWRGRRRGRACCG